ncbi:serine hydrolase domain-containing protein [Aquimarina sp. MAR_2010_214]|uniref:serine hydrolase domain-containing protein n=1 Tax=Aquimarina sp. MAR_2010_214 TaxID=1250026 RepID=UPI00130425A4|nr:serine hydrolase domain-containing protein [Aquimarina sp. MAR_2010_214]
MKHYGIPGVSIAVIHNGKIAWAKGYGIMDKESKAPVTEQTIFQASLLGMPLTAYGALRLVEQNKVTLNENINSYLKSWKLPDNEFTKEKKATIKNLLNHSAGINLHGIPGYSTDSPVPTLVEILNGTPPAKNGPILVNIEPDERIYVSAGGYAIIQQMMIDVEGKKFPELMNELVMQPLEMNNSTFNQPLTTKHLAMAATGYLKDGSMVKGKRHTYPGMASNGLWSNAEGLAKFVINIQQTLRDNSNKGLSKDMTALMLTPYGVNSYYSRQFKYGLGFGIMNKKDEIYFRHWGWNRVFFGQIAAHRDKDFGVVVLTNSTYPAFNDELIRSVALAYEWDNYVPVHKKIEVEQSLVDKITGRYMSNGRIVEVFHKDNQLFYKNILDLEAEELIKISDSSFVRRNSSRLMQFKPNSENEALNLLYLNRNDGTITSTFVKMDTDKKEPVEFLLEGDFDKALNAYMALKEHDPTYLTVTEDYLNDLGYDFFHEDRMKLSQDVFKVNMMLYPDSYKVYDSYAEACAKIGEIDMAILNYTKSLELNPQNNNTRQKIKELQKSE